MGCERNKAQEPCVAHRSQTSVFISLFHSYPEPTPCFCLQSSPRLYVSVSECLFPGFVPGFLVSYSYFTLNFKMKDFAIKCSSTELYPPDEGFGMNRVRLVLVYLSPGADWEEVEPGCEALPKLLHVLVLIFLPGTAHPFRYSSPSQVRLPRPSCLLIPLPRPPAGSSQQHTLGVHLLHPQPSYPADTSH